MALAYSESEFKGVSLRLNGVFVPPEKINPTPSELEGLSSETEMKLRIIGCESIEDAGKLLKLPQVTVASAEVLYHRFYFSKSFVKHNWEHYAMACVFLSAKIEETCRRLRDIVNVFVHIRQLREQKILKPLSLTDYSELKPHIIKAERRILKELGFCVHGKHPHKLIIMFMHIFNQKENGPLIQLSWNYMNDSLRTTAFVTYEPEVIACACIYLAARHLQIPLGTNWFEIFGYTEEIIQEICLIILQLYSFDKCDLLKLESEVSELRRSQIETRNKKINEQREEQQAKKQEIEKKDKENIKTNERSTSKTKQIKKKKSPTKERSRSRRRDRGYSRDRSNKNCDHRRNRRREDSSDNEQYHRRYKKSDYKSSGVSRNSHRRRRSQSRGSSSSSGGRRYNKRPMRSPSNDRNYSKYGSGSKLTRRYNGVQH